MSITKGQFSFFNLETHLEKIYRINHFLLKLNVLINWEIFRETLNIVREKDRKSNAGRPPFDVMLMFKVLVLKFMDHLSDEQTELQIHDHISFRDFLSLNSLSQGCCAFFAWIPHKSEKKRLPTSLRPGA